MDAKLIRGLQPMLARFLKRFDDCFARKDTRAHLTVYVNGQLSDLPRKSVEPIALASGVPVRTLQEFLSQHRWLEDLARNRLQEIVAEDHSHPHSVGVIDETSFVKQGDKTPGVQRQYLGTIGKQENGIVTVHLAYAADDFHCLLDGELFLPESWAGDPARCREAQIPEGMTYRPKTEIALELYDRAGQRRAVCLADVRRVVWRKTRVFAGIGRPGAAVRGRSAAHPDGLDRSAARDESALSPRPRPRPQDAANRLRQSSGNQGREHAQVRAGTAGPRVGAVSRQGRPQGADPLGGQTRAVLPSRAGWPAHRPVAFDGCPQCT